MKVFFLSAFLDVNKINDYADKFFHLLGWYSACHTMNDYLRLTMLAYQFITGRFVHRDFFKYVTSKYFDNNLQSDEGFKVLQMLRAGFTQVQSIDNCELVKKTTAMYSYLLVHGFLERFGMEVNDEDYSRIERKGSIIEVFF